MQTPIIKHNRQPKIPPTRHGPSTKHKNKTNKNSTTRHTTTNRTKKLQPKHQKRNSPKNTSRGDTMIIALVGNQNCGKTTIFNKITNLNQHVGNFPGVTVEYKIGEAQNHPHTQIVDLPGLYSLNTYTQEEKVTKDFIYQAKPDIIINVVDASHLNRNLYLTLQLKETKIPMIIALNMMDEIKKNKNKIDTKALSSELNLPIVELTTVTQDETNKLIQEATKLKKRYILNKPNLQNKESIYSKYNQIEKICAKTTNIHKNKQKETTHKIDKILTNRILGIPIFILTMYLIFNLTFNVIGNYCTNLLNHGIEVTTQIVQNYLENYNTIIESLIIDGIISGICSVISFLPIIVTLYFFLSILEDSGYMTRIAFLIDEILSKIGLSGKGIVPILLGFGCSVPAVLSVRTIQSEKEKNLCLTLIPFISCSAKIPIYSIFVSIFFKENPALAMTTIYIAGILLGIIITAIINKISKTENDGTFIMEMPNYRMPSLKNTLILMWNKTKDFLEKSFSIIFISSIIIWFLKSFDINLIYVQEEKSMLATIGMKISNLFKPIGLGDWRITTAIITGISAKEAILSTLSVLCNSNISTLVTAIKEIFTIKEAISFITFILLYTPCIATIGVIKKEFGIKKAIKIVFNQFFIAYITSFLILHLTLNFL